MAHLKYFPLATVALLLLVCLRRSDVRWPWRQEPAAARALRRQLGPGFFLQRIEIDTVHGFLPDRRNAHQSP